MRGFNHHDDWGWANAPRFGGGGGGGTTSTNTIQNTSPWAGQQPFLVGGGGQYWAPTANGNVNASDTSGIFGSAAALYENPSDWAQYFPGSTYVPLTGVQNGFIGNIQNYGWGGGNTGIQSANSAESNLFSPSYTSEAQQPFDAANSYLTNTINGSGLDITKQPGWQNAVNTALASAIPQSQASFISGGRTDSGLAQAAETSAATNAVGNLANQAYLGQEQLQQGAANTAANDLLTQQGNQVRGMYAAPGIDQSQLQDLNAGLSAAGLSQQNGQNNLNAEIQQWNYNQNLPLNELGAYAGLVGGTGYGSSSSGLETQPYYSNGTANLLSGLAGGAGILGATGAFGSSGWLGPALTGLGSFLGF